MVRFLSCISIAILATACSGCGRDASNRPPLAVVKGKIELDGKPLESGSIETSVAAGRGALGAIQNGKFELSTFGTDDGATLGTHKVAVIARGPGEPGPEGKPGKLLVPERYTSPQTSGLTIEVKEGDNTPELKLTSP